MDEVRQTRRLEAYHVYCRTVDIPSREYRKHEPNSQMFDVMSGYLH